MMNLKEYQMRYRLEHKQVGKEYHKQYYLKNREKLRNKQKARYVINRQKILLQMKEHSRIPEVNERKKKYHKQYCIEHEQELKEKKKRYLQRPDVKQKRKESITKYYSRPEIKKRKREYDLEYYSRPTIRERTKKYNKEYQAREYVTQKEKLRSQTPHYIETKRQYKQKYNLGLVFTPTLKKAQKRIRTIRMLYAQRMDAYSIAKALGFSRTTITAILKANNILLRPRRYAGRKRDIVCLNGTKVRSYPEKIIADTLFKNKIPFVYEKKILCENTRFYPDFYIPDRDLYIEYAGLAGIPKYDLQLERKKLAMKKLKMNYLIMTKPEQICEALSWV
jgi:hypothetical protein